MVMCVVSSNIVYMYAMYAVSHSHPPTHHTHHYSHIPRTDPTGVSFGRLYDWQGYPRVARGTKGVVAADHGRCSRMGMMCCLYCILHHMIVLHAMFAAQRIETANIPTPLYTYPLHYTHTHSIIHIPTPLYTYPLHYTHTHSIIHIPTPLYTYPH